MEHISETVEFIVNSRQVLTVTVIDAMALSTVCAGHHESGHLSAPTSVTQRDIVLGAPLEIADSTTGTAADSIDEIAARLRACPADRRGQRTRVRFLVEVPDPGTVFAALDQEPDGTLAVWPAVSRGSRPRSGPGGRRRPGCGRRA